MITIKLADSGQATCKHDGQSYQVDGPDAVMKMNTMLWLSGHNQARYQVLNEGEKSPSSSDWVRNYATIDKDGDTFVLGLPEGDVTDGILVLSFEL